MEILPIPKNRPLTHRTTRRMNRRMMTMKAKMMLVRTTISKEMMNQLKNHTPPGKKSLARERRLKFRQHQIMTYRKMKVLSLILQTMMLKQLQKNPILLSMGRQLWAHPLVLRRGRSYLKLSRVQQSKI